MGQSKYIRNYRKGKHLTYEDRLRFEYYYKENQHLSRAKRLTVIELAKAIGISRSTFYYELKKGLVYLQHEEEPVYSADIAQDVTDYNVSSRGPDLKIGSFIEVADFIEKMIVDQDYSPEAVVHLMRQTPQCYAFIPCTRTIYNYIEKGIFARLTIQDLPREGKQSKRKYRRRRKVSRDPEAKMITDRPEFIDHRTEIGHWEMDCIESGKKSDGHGLLVMLERATRYVQIMRLNSITQAEVLRCINNLEEELGTTAFQKTFKSFTVDNGSEFLDWRSIEASCIYPDTYRTQVFYCHPYSAYERGSVENVNKLARRKIPKGSNISSYNDKYIQSVEDWINQYPRSIHQGRSALQLMDQNNSALIA